MIFCSACADFPEFSAVLLGIDPAAARNMPIQSFRELEIWRQGVDLVSDIYQLTASFPPHERYGLASQLQRAAVSIPSNIAEGSRQKATVALIRYLRHALASGAEAETHLEIVRRLRYAKEEEIRAREQQLVSIAKMTYTLIANLKRSRRAQRRDQSKGE